MGAVRQAIMVAFLLVAIIIDAAMVAFAVTRPQHSRALCFAALSGYLFLYTLGYLLEVLCITSEAAYIALCIENIGIPMMAPCFLLNAVSFFQPRLLKKWMLPVAVAYGFIMFLIVLSNPMHELYYPHITIVPQGSYSYVELGRGPLYFLQQGITVSLNLLAYFVLLQSFRRGTKKMRKQMMFFICGSLFAFAAHVLTFAGWLPVKIDPTPFALTIGLVFFSIDLLRTRMMDIVAVAFSSAVDTMNDALVVLDSDGGFVYCNANAQRLFPALAGYALDEPIANVPNWPGELALDGQERVTTFRQHVQGEERSFLSNVSEVRSTRGKRIGWSMVMRDNTDMDCMVAQLEKLATTDSLTGIYNRRHFISLTTRDLEMAHRHHLAKGLVSFDIDHFKVVNDTYGHHAGDQVLLSITKAVAEQLRSYDLFARFGGEEFVIMTTANSGKQEDLIAFAERLRTTVEQLRIDYEGQSLRVTASFGATIIESGCAFDMASRCVDAAMYEAKTLGRNRTVFKDTHQRTP